MTFTYRRSYRGKLQAAIFDWAGTVLDYGCLAPAVTFIEGFKREGHDKIEIHRRETGKPLLYPDDPHIVAVLSDEPLPDCPLPVISIDDIGAVADFILSHFGRARG